MSNLRELFKSYKKVGLPASEKSVIRGRILDLMQNGLEPRRGFSLFVFSWRFSAPVLIALLIIILGGGTAFVAAGSVPGDALYTVKVNINEPVKVAFAVSASAQAELQSKLAQERLKEAEELASENRLDAVVEAAVAAAPRRVRSQRPKSLPVYRIA